MKKIKFPMYSIVALSLVFLFSIFIIAADFLVNDGIYFYTGLPFFTTGNCFVMIFLVGGTLFVSAIAVFLHKNLKRKWLKIIITLVSGLISATFLGMVVVSTVLFMPQTYVEILSDNEEHCIIIGEDCYFFSPYGGDVFEKTSFCTMKKLKKYVADKDFYTPFSDEKYSVIWNAENFELFYDSDGDGEMDERLLIEYLP